jgi:hypothetical protein
MKTEVGTLCIMSQLANSEQVIYLTYVQQPRTTKPNLFWKNILKCLATIKKQTYSTWFVPQGSMPLA